LAAGLDQKRIDLVPTASRPMRFISRVKPVAIDVFERFVTKRGFGSLVGERPRNFMIKPPSDQIVPLYFARTRNRHTGAVVKQLITDGRQSAERLITFVVAPAKPSGGWVAGRLFVFAFN